MQALFFVINRTDILEDILSAFNNQGISGATVFDSTGMGTVLECSHNNSIPLFGSIKQILNNNRPFNKTVFTVIQDNQVPQAISTIKGIVGDFSHADTGIIFTIPVNFAEGIDN